MDKGSAQGTGRTDATAIDCGGARRCLARLAAGLRGLLADRAGATAIEYGIIAVLIAVGIMTAVQSIGDTENESFTTLSTGLNTDPPLSVPPFANKTRPPADPWAPDGGSGAPPEMAAPPMRRGATPPAPTDGGGLPTGALDPATAPPAAVDPGSAAGGAAGGGAAGAGGATGPVSAPAAADQLMFNASAPPPPTQ